MSFSPLDSELLGPLFRTDAMAALFADASLVGAMLRVEAALARVQARHGLVPAGLAEAIAAITPESLDIPMLGRGTALAGVPAVPFVKAVQKRLPAELEAGFHHGATTQDVVDGALVLLARDAFALLAADLAAVLAALETLAADHRETPCAGRTYGQHAAPVTFGYKAAVWLAGIADEARALAGVRERVLVASLGGPVGTLAALGDKGPAVLQDFAAELGLAVPVLAWHTRRGGVAAAGLWLASLMAALGKMALDVTDLASTELGEVAEPYLPGRGGSSAMPHKRNPVSCTIISAAADAARGPAMTLVASMQQAAHERPAGAWHAEWQALPALFGLASGALAEARRLTEGLDVHAARMRANLDLTRGLLFADAAAGVIASAAGRAEAHRIVEAAAARVRDRDGTLLDALAGAADLPAGLDRSALEGAFDLRPAIAAAARFVDRAVNASAAIRATLVP
jgi:3-carboxy-cis,cis-muconate cycloisomerase